jgi:3-methylfumaryl-CoA hydratase
MDVARLQSWIGREDRQRDIIDAIRARRMHALFDRSQAELQPGSPLPSGYHWLYCVTITPRSEWGADGHARRGGFLPPLEGTRRMWAGGALHFLQPLHIGDDVERHSAIASIEQKDGRAGRFCLVRIAHRITSPRVTAIDEQQHLVYLPESVRPSAAASTPLTQTTDWEDAFSADEVALFYFSALTLNGHRIHYDHPYATREEGYAGLLVHAPLTALLLLDAARRRGFSIRTFEYRAIAPLFCRETITLAGKRQPDESMSLWALRPDGGIAMQATATTREPDTNTN